MPIFKPKKTEKQISEEKLRTTFGAQIEAYKVHEKELITAIANKATEIAEASKAGEKDIQDEHEKTHKVFVDTLVQVIKDRNDAEIKVLDTWKATV